MKKALIYFVLGAVTLTFQGCKNDQAAEEKVEETKNCFYSYNSGTTLLEWTAFKFTEKAPVKGTFNDIKIEGIKGSDDPRKVIESLQFTIETASVETQNPERNEKIARLFFGTIGSPQLTGKVKTLSDNGKATIEIKMNNLTKEVIGDYTMEGAKFYFHATIDVVNWNASSGIKELNTACKELHTGADGKSKLWSEVDLTFTTELASDCD